MAFNQETSKRTLESGGHENENGEELNSSEDEENEVVDDDVAFRSEVKAALGPAVMDTDKEVGTTNSLLCIWFYGHSSKFWKHTCMWGAAQCTVFQTSWVHASLRPPPGIVIC